MKEGEKISSAVRPAMMIASSSHDDSILFTEAHQVKGVSCDIRDTLIRTKNSQLQIHIVASTDSR